MIESINFLSNVNSSSWQVVKIPKQKMKVFFDQGQEGSLLLVKVFHEAILFFMIDTTC